MKKSVLNLVFYLVCFIVLLLFAAMFFNWKSLEGFREGADETAATTDNTAATTDNTAATTGNTVVTSTDTTVPVSSTTTSGSSYVSPETTVPASSTTTTGSSYVAADSTVPASSTTTTGTTYVAPDTTTNTSATSSTVVATPASTVSTNPSCVTIIGDDKLGVYLKPKKHHLYPISYTTSPDIRSLAIFILENGKQVQSVDYGKNTKVFFAPTTAVVGGMAYGKFCTETDRTRTKIPITYTSNTLQVKYDKTDYYVVFVNDAGKYVAAMKRVGDSNLSPNMIRNICQTMK